MNVRRLSSMVYYMLPQQHRLAPHLAVKLVSDKATRSTSTCFASTIATAATATSSSTTATTTSATPLPTS